MTVFRRDPFNPDPKKWSRWYAWFPVLVEGAEPWYRRIAFSRYVFRRVSPDVLRIGDRSYRRYEYSPSA